VLLVLDVFGRRKHVLAWLEAVFLSGYRTSAFLAPILILPLTLTRSRPPSLTPTRRSFAFLAARDPRPLQTRGACAKSFLPTEARRRTRGGCVIAQRKCSS
jgi:hypothetical protein